MKEPIKRALRTFVQSAAGYISVNIGATVTGIEDANVVKTAVTTLIVSAIAAGIAAVMNMKPTNAGTLTGDEDVSEEEESEK